MAVFTPMFAFERGAVKLEDGVFFLPSRQAKRRWLLRRDFPIRWEQPHFLILYELDKAQYVLIQYSRCYLLEPESEEELWKGEFEAQPRRMGSEEAVEFFLFHQLDMPDSLERTLEVLDLGAKDGVEMEGEDLDAASLTPEDFEKLPKRIRTAGLSYELAESNIPQTPDSPLTDRAAYNWLRENIPDAYALPQFRTWRRYLNLWRNQSEKKKNSPRAGREGRSVVKQSEI